jgi:hypothetical protein
MVIFAVGIWGENSLDGGCVATEKRTVHVVIPMSDLFEACGCRLKFIVEYIIFDQQFVVVSADTIHFGSVKKERKKQIDN